MNHDDVEARRQQRQREAFAQRCADAEQAVREADMETLADAVSLWHKLVRLPDEHLTPLTNYAMCNNLRFEEAIVELVLKGLEDTE